MTLQVWNLTAIPYNSKELTEAPGGFDPQQEGAFICNLQVSTKLLGYHCVSDQLLCRKQRSDTWPHNIQQAATDWQSLRVPLATATSIASSMQEHWFTIRKINSDWWNFNSLYPAPEQLSAFYLTAYLDSLREQGYTIFVIRGELPQSAAASGATDIDGPGKWWDAEEVSHSFL